MQNNQRQRVKALYGVVSATGEIKLVAKVTRTKLVRRKLQIHKDLYYKRLAEMIPCPNRDYEGICLIAMKPCRGVCYEGSECNE